MLPSTIQMLIDNSDGMFQLLINNVSYDDWFHALDMYDHVLFSYLHSQYALYFVCLQFNCKLRLQRSTHMRRNEGGLDRCCPSIQTLFDISK